MGNVELASRSIVANMRYEEFRQKIGEKDVSLKAIRNTILDVDEKAELT